MPPTNKTVLSMNWGFTIGGVTQYNVLLKRVEDYQPIAVRYICIIDDSWHCDETSLSQLNAEIIRIKSRLDVSWVPRVARALKRISPNLIISHGFNAHFVTWLVTRLYGICAPKVMSYHGVYYPGNAFRRPLAPIFNWFTDRYAREDVKSVVSVSEFSKKHLLSRGVPEEKITVIHNGIPDSSVSAHTRMELRHSWGVAEHHVVLGATSRLEKIKGLDYLISAMGALSPQFPGLRLILVGTGGTELSLKRYAAQLGISSKVIFAGFRSDIPECLEAFDVFILPSLAENHSIALLEAMRASKTIIATSVGGNTESVRDRQEAIIVCPGDAGAQVAAIKDVLNKPELAKSLATAAHQRFIDEFRDSTMIERTAVWLMKCMTRDHRQE